VPDQLAGRGKRGRVAALVAVLCAGCASAPEPAASPDDAAFRLPGTFSEQTTLAELQARFGRSNVRVVEASGEDGRTVVLFAGDPTRRAFVEFHDDRNLVGVRRISVRDAGSRWRGKQGVHVGMTFAALAAANGKPFIFSGFDDHGRGWAHDQWSPALDGDGGSLGRLDVGEGEQMYFDVELGLRGGGAGLPAGAYPRDDNLLSDDARYPRLGELVEVTGFGASTSLDDEW
jgi:hypothetical protein